MLRWSLVILVLDCLTLGAVFAFDSNVLRLTAIIGGTCLALWLSEIVPPFVPTFLLWTLTPLLLGPFDAKFDLSNVMRWALDPVLALFFGGFALGVAAEQYGIDRWLANGMLRLAGSSFAWFLLTAIFLTAFLSAWMSNIAAAALMLVSLRPILAGLELNSVLRRATLVGVALGANLGGISTPIGTGPNAIAIASISASTHISFVEWMIFAAPLAVGMLVFGFGLLWMQFRPGHEAWVGRASSARTPPANDAPRSRRHLLLAVFILTIMLWLTEPLHGVPSSVVSLASASLLFLTQLLKKEDLLRIDWSTLLLIAGGITLGRLLEKSGLVMSFAGNINWNELNVFLSLFLLCFASAVLSALMSNTATVVILVPFAQAILPGPATAILVAIAASFGMPFQISTPPNAMVYGEGGVRFDDLFRPGMMIMVLGCLIIALTGSQILRAVGI
jgi:sodium-dependent dicarboxylate transporter 2/3/5